MSRFVAIVADPPWAFGDRLKRMKSKTKRAAEQHYPTMTLEQICNIDVKSLVDPSGCVLVMWVPATLIAQGMQVMQSWGFTYKSLYCWVKTGKEGKLAFGMGHMFRQCNEVALVGISGKGVYKALKNRSQRSVLLAPAMKHSAKPEGLQDAMDVMFSGPKLEMFARRVRAGWTCLGNEIDGADINDAVKVLAEGEKASVE